MTLFHSYLSPRIATFLLLTALLIGLEVIITRTVVFSQHPITLSLGVAFDLVVVTTVLFYWLVARPLRLANNRLVLMALLMLRIALLILPEVSFLPNQFWPLLLAFVEGAALIIAGLRIRTIAQTYQHLRLTTDAETALQGSLSTVFDERASGLILGEGLTLYYALFGWWLRCDVPDGSKPLTTHQQSGQLALTIGLLLVGVIEGVTVHLLISRWNPIAAFWITALSAYGMLFFVADIIATVKRPSYLTDTQLQLRLGIRWRATISHLDIAGILLIHDKPAKQSGRLNGAFLTAPNVLVTFHEPVCFTGPYGIQKQVKEFSFFVDDRSVFSQYLCSE